jgi:hypothetical protein
MFSPCITPYADYKADYLRARNGGGKEKSGSTQRARRSQRKTREKSREKQRKDDAPQRTQRAQRKARERRKKTGAATPRPNVSTDS